VNVARVIALSAVFLIVTAVAIFTLRGISTSSQSETHTLVQSVVSTATPTPIEETDDYKQGFRLGQKHAAVSAHDQTSGAPTELGFQGIASNWHENKEYSGLDLSKFESGYEDGFRQAFQAIRTKKADHIATSRLTFVNVWKVKEGTKLYGPDGTRIGTAWEADTFSGQIKYAEWITGNVLVETSDEMNHRNWKMLK
jgi:hypothetical protein